MPSVWRTLDSDFWDATVPDDYFAPDAGYVDPRRAVLLRVGRVVGRGGVLDDDASGVEGPFPAGGVFVRPRHHHICGEECLGGDPAAAAVRRHDNLPAATRHDHPGCPMNRGGAAGCFHHRAHGCQILIVRCLKRIQGRGEDGRGNDGVRCAEWGNDRASDPTATDRAA